MPPFEFPHEHVVVGRVGRGDLWKKGHWEAASDEELFYEEEKSQRNLSLELHHPQQAAEETCVHVVRTHVCE